MRVLINAFYCYCYWGAWEMATMAQVKGGNENNWI